MNFGKAIVLSFVLFGLFIGVLVGVCIRQDVSLVSKDYYQEELDYQHKLDKINNANSLASLPEITAVQGRVRVVYAGFGTMQAGELKLSRPSNARLDEKFSLVPVAGDSQEFALRFWEPGLYRASLTWTAGGKTYEVEKAIVF
jgi:hypothetical protein